MENKKSLTVEDLVEVVGGARKKTKTHFKPSETEGRQRRSRTPGVDQEDEHGRSRLPKSYLGGASSTLRRR